MDDVLRTGADGNAVVTVPLHGQISLLPNTKVSFQKVPRYLASLENGKLLVRSLAGLRSFQIRTGPFIVVPISEMESTFEMERLPDGSGSVNCSAGSVGVIALEGPAAVFINAGESVGYAADGRIAKAAAPDPAKPSETTPVPQPPQTQPKKKSNAKMWAIVAAAGGAGGALAAAGGGGGRSAVSPSAP